jgi:hypothetical protein
MSLLQKMRNLDKLKQDHFNGKSDFQIFSRLLRHKPGYRQDTWIQNGDYGCSWRHGEIGIDDHGVELVFNFTDGRLSCVEVQTLHGAGTVVDVNG